MSHAFHSIFFWTTFQVNCTILDEMRSLLPTLFSILLLFACGSDELPEPAKTKPNYFPDAVGSRWVYRNADGSEWIQEIIDSSDSQDRDYLTFIYKPSITVTDVDFLSPTFFSVNQKQILFDVGEQIDRYIQTDLITSIKDEFEGLEVNATLEPISYPDLLFLQIPLISNSQWNVLDVEVNGNISLQNLNLLNFPFEVHFMVKGVVLSEEAIETLAGMFETTFQIKYDTNIMQTLLSNEVSVKRDQIIWFVPYVGIVKIEDERGISELIEYNLQ